MNGFASTSFHFPLIWPVWPLGAVSLTSVFSWLTPFGQVIKEKSLPLLSSAMCVFVLFEMTNINRGKS